jgi:diguanylate cyclase (GGDEF)-like protein
MKEIKKPPVLRRRDIDLLFNLVHSDFLTGLYNRQGFIREAERYIKEINGLKKFKKKRRIYFRNFSVIFIDFDGLKLINDKFGHRVGDKALKLTAKVLQDSVRDFDIVSRWGGDEFIIGLIDTNKEEALKVVGRIKRKLASVRIKRQNLSVSFGVAVAVDKKEKVLNLYELIERADMAMYEAKKTKTKTL